LSYDHSSLSRVRELKPQKSPVRENMKIALNIAGVILVVFGCVWFLQGINVLPGSFMTGQIRWAVYGGVAMIAGIVLMLSAKHGRRKAR